MNHKAIVLTLITIVLFTPLTVFATAQQPDVLIYKNERRSLFANPLESFYKREKDRPRFFVEPGVWSTGNWRGYVATWTIEDSVLYLVEIDAWFCRGRDLDKCEKVELKNLFGNRFRDGRVKADWFSGELRVPDGKQLRYVHMGYGSVYEREIVLTVEGGKVVGEKTVDNTQRRLPSELELQRQELEKMKPTPTPTPSVWLSSERFRRTASGWCKLS